jgi:hypothetical protein
MSTEKKHWILNMVSEGSEVSMKRVVTSCAFLLLAFAFVLNLFWHIKVSESLLNIMENIVFAGVFATAGENIASKFSKKTTPTVVVNDKSTTVTQNAGTNENPTI